MRNMVVVGTGMFAKRKVWKESGGNTDEEETWPFRIGKAANGACVHDCKAGVKRKMGRIDEITRWRKETWEELNRK